MRHAGWLVLGVVLGACVQPPPAVAPVCEVAERLEFDVAQPSRVLTVSNPLEVPGVVTITAPPAPFSVEGAGTYRLAPHEVREVVVRYSPTRSADVTWQFTPAVGCEPVGVTLSGVAAEAAVTASPGRLDFGALPASPRALTLRNHTHAEVQVRTLSFSSAAFSSATEVPLVIPALGSVEILVLAQGAGPLDGLLTIATTAGDLTVPLLANRVDPCLIASRSSMDFAALELACRARDELVSVTNTCPHAVRDVEGTVTPGFRIVAGKPAPVLGPGSSVSFAVTSGLDAAGRSTGAFSVSADVLDGTEAVTVQLTGERTPITMREEVYTNPRPQRDLLIVLDDSPSMAPFEDAYRLSMNELAHLLIAYQESVRVGVMTTSTAPAELGRLRRTSSGQAWLQNPTVEEFEAHVRLTGTSTARSSCVEVLYEAFTTRAELDSLLRPQARLQVICITSRADQLELPAAPVIASLSALMPRSRAIVVVANFNDVPGCAASRNTGVLSSFAEFTNSWVEELCSPRWILEDFRTHGGGRTYFFLSERPDLTRLPIEVQVNGTAVPDDGWEYESANNAVNLSPLYVPAYDQTLRLRYAPHCP